MTYYNKYLKYKNKYLSLKKQLGGASKIAQDSTKNTLPGSSEKKKFCSQI